MNIPKHESLPHYYHSLRPANTSSPKGSSIRPGEASKRASLRRTDSIKGSGIRPTTESPKGSTISGFKSDSPRGPMIKKALVFFQQEQERAASPMISSPRSEVLLSSRDGSVHKKIVEIERNSPLKSSPKVVITPLNLPKKLSYHTPLNGSPRIEEIKNSDLSNLQRRASTPKEGKVPELVRRLSSPKESSPIRSRLPDIPVTQATTVNLTNSTLRNIPKHPSNDKFTLIPGNELRQKLQTKPENTFVPIPRSPPLGKSESALKVFKDIFTQNKVTSTPPPVRVNEISYKGFLNEVENILGMVCEGKFYRRDSFQLVTLPNGSLTWVPIHSSNFEKGPKRTLSFILKKLILATKCENKELPGQIRYICDHLLENTTIRASIIEYRKLRFNLIKLGRNILYYHLYKDIKEIKQMIKDSTINLKMIHDYLARDQEIYVREIFKPYNSKKELSQLSSSDVSLLIIKLNHESVVESQNENFQRKHLEKVYERHGLIPIRTKSLPEYSLDDFIERVLDCCRQFIKKYSDLLDLDKCLSQMPESYNHGGSRISIKSGKVKAREYYNKLDYTTTISEVMRADTTSFAIYNCKEMLPVALRDLCKRTLKVLQKTNPCVISKEDVIELEKRIDLQTGKEIENSTEKPVVQWEQLTATLMSITKYFPDLKNSNKSGNYGITKSTAP